MRPGEIFLAQSSQTRIPFHHLKTMSALRLHKLATIHCSSLIRYLGLVEASLQTAVASKLRDLLRL
jgi:hypothetical protein